MRLGIFAKTFPGTDPAAVLRAVRDAGFEAAQFNLACAGLDPVPADVPEAAVAVIGQAAARAGVELAALSGTVNMAHPDPVTRADGSRRLAAVIDAAARLGIPLVTLCTGTRHPTDQWTHHPGNAAPDAWADMRAELDRALDAAERRGVDLGIEPERANVVSSAAGAMRLIRETGSKRLRVVLDPANLFERASRDEARRIVAEAVEATAGHVAMAHAKDRHADGRFATAGQGVVDFPDFVARLEDAGFRGALVTHGLEAAEAPGVARFLRDLLA